MSRIGRMPVAIPAGVTVTVAEGNVVTVKGALGTLTKNLSPMMDIKVEDVFPTLLPFIGATFICIALLIAFPQLLLLPTYLMA